MLARVVLVGAGGLLVGLAALTAFSPLRPIAWSPPTDAISRTACAAAPVLTARVLTEGLPGRPDGLAFAPDGSLHVALSTGRIVAVSTKSGAWRIVAQGFGQLTGLATAADGTDFVADERGGRLLSAERDGRLRTRLDSVDGQALTWANDVAALADGRIVFTTTALGRNLDDFYPEVLTHRGSGRLILFDPTSGRARTLIRDLQMANGVAVNARSNSVVVAETSVYGVRLVSLSGGGASHLYGLPGFVGNLRAADRPAVYWLTLLSPRSPLIDDLSGWPLVRRLLYWLPEAVRPKPQPLACVIRLHTSGNGLSAKAFRIGGAVPTTSYSTAIERAERLYLTPASIVEGAPRAVYEADLPAIMEAEGNSE
jgi:sugar lactone lactonase YvrE